VKNNGSILLVAVLCVLLWGNQWGDFLYTVDGKVYEGKMVAFKYNVVFFNVYKFGRLHKMMRFPLPQVWKMEFNTPQKDGLPTPFDIDSSYDKFRKGKRVKTIELKGTENWVDTGIDVRVGQDILFSITGSINIDAESQVYQNGELNLTINRRKPLANQPTGSVISRVGKRGEAFYVGDDKAPFYMSNGGRLFIGINDFDFTDNSGSFSVKIYY
jgi:hypothetical protein